MRKQPKRRNVHAAALRDPLFRRRVVGDKKKEADRKAARKKEKFDEL